MRAKEEAMDMIDGEQSTPCKVTCRNQNMGNLGWASQSQAESSDKIHTAQRLIEGLLKEICRVHRQRC
jgi:hypothetical protein